MPINFLAMNGRLFNWVLFGILSLTWGSSFILMKAGMEGLSAYQVASIRIVSAGMVLLPIAIKSFKKIPPRLMKYVFLSGMLGSLLPAYLFCIAEQKVDSGLAGVLNSLTPIFVIIAGALFFNSKVSANKIAGICIAFSGSVLLYFFQPVQNGEGNLMHVLLILLATASYGFNVNLVHQYLRQIPSLQIAAVAMLLNAIPALLVLLFTGYFGNTLLRKEVWVATGYSALLGVLGTAIATILFYMLLKRAGAVFASMVTYGIPIVALGWAMVYGEEVGWPQALGMLVILVGVFVANSNLFKKQQPVLE